MGFNDYPKELEKSPERFKRDLETLRVERRYKIREMKEIRAHAELLQEDLETIMEEIKGLESAGPDSARTLEVLRRKQRELEERFGDEVVAPFEKASAEYDEIMTALQDCENLFKARGDHFRDVRMRTEGVTLDEAADQEYDKAEEFGTEFKEGQDEFDEEQDELERVKSKVYRL